MTKDEAILKIKDQLKKLMSFSSEADDSAEQTEEKKFISMKLKDGSEISILDGTELGVGTEVFIVDTDGNQKPIDDDSYVLDDGRTIVVKGGKVESISEADSTQEDAKTETPETSAQMESTEDEKDSEKDKEKMSDGEETTSVEERVSNLENQISQILEILQGMNSMQEVAMSKIKEIEDAPAVPSVKTGKVINTGNQAFSSIKNEIDELKEMKKKFNLVSNGGYTFKATQSIK